MMRSTHSPIRRGLLSTLFTLLVLTWTFPLRADTAPTPPASLLPPNTVERISGLATQALLETARARQALDDKHTEETLATLGQVRVLVEMAAAARPTASANNLLGYLRLQLKTEDNQEALADLLPAYRALHRLPVDRLMDARQAFDHLKQALQNGDRASALKALDTSEHALSIDFIDLPLAAAREDVRTLLGTLRKGKTPAKADLLKLEQHLLELAESAEQVG